MIEVNSERWLDLTNFDGEVWRKIESSKEHGIYYVSNYGRVKRKKFFGGRYHFPEMIFRQHLSRANGYYKVRVAGKMYAVHKLVALAFLPPRPGATQVDHRNGIKADNRAVNLHWVTQKENVNNPITLWRQRHRGCEAVPDFLLNPTMSKINIKKYHPKINLSKGILPPLAEELGTGEPFCGLLFPDA